eukprot:gene4317-5041_t
MGVPKLWELVQPSGKTIEVMLIHTLIYLVSFGEYASYYSIISNLSLYSMVLFLI